MTRLTDLIKTFLLCLAFFYITPAIGQNKSSYSPRIANFEYIETIKGTNKRDLPLLIAFHYSSGNPVETIIDYDSLKHPVRIIIPKGNYPKRNGFSYFPPDYYQKDSSTQFALAKITVDSIAAFVKAIEKKHKRKAIISGISQGGDIALLLAIYYPELCRASFPFAAVIHPEVIDRVKLKPVRAVPIFLFQGEADKIINVDFTREKVEQIGKMLNIKLQTYPNLGHDISVQMKIDYSKLIDGINKL